MSEDDDSRILWSRFCLRRFNGSTRINAPGQVLRDVREGNGELAKDMARVAPGVVWRRPFN